MARDQAALEAQRRVLALASLSATLVTSLLEALVALAIARLVARPWERLRGAVERVSEDDPGSADLGAAARCPAALEPAATAERVKDPARHTHVSLR